MKKTLIYIAIIIASTAICIAAIIAEQVTLTTFILIVLSLIFLICLALIVFKS